MTRGSRRRHTSARLGAQGEREGPHRYNWDETHALNARIAVFSSPDGIRTHDLFLERNEIKKSDLALIKTEKQATNETN